MNRSHRIRKFQPQGSATVASRLADHFHRVCVFFVCATILQERVDLGEGAPDGHEPTEHEVHDGGLREDGEVGGLRWRWKCELRGVQEDDDPPPLASEFGPSQMREMMSPVG